MALRQSILCQTLFLSEECKQMPSSDCMAGSVVEGLFYFEGGIRPNDGWLSYAFTYTYPVRMRATFTKSANSANSSNTYQAPYSQAYFTAPGKFLTTQKSLIFLTCLPAGLTLDWLTMNNMSDLNISLSPFLGCGVHLYPVTSPLTP